MSNSHTFSSDSDDEHSSFSGEERSLSFSDGEYFPKLVPRTEVEVVMCAQPAYIAGNDKTRDEVVSDLSFLVNNKQFSDVTFVVGSDGEEVYANSAILTARCEVFSKMFSSGFCESLHDGTESRDTTSGGRKKKRRVVQIPNIEAEIMIQFLTFLYTGKIRISADTVLAVYATAHQYMVQSLANLCLRDLANFLDIHNLYYFIQQAVQNHWDKIRDVCLEHIGKCGILIFKKEEWKMLSEQAVLAIVQSDRLTVPEIEIWKAVIDWGKNHLKREQKPHTQSKKKKEAEGGDDLEKKKKKENKKEQ